MDIDSNAGVKTEKLLLSQSQSPPSSKINHFARPLNGQEIQKLLFWMAIEGIIEQT